MKQVLLVLLIGFGMSSCKEVKTYTLNFEATHIVEQENMFTNPGAYYGWGVESDNGTIKFDRSGTIVRKTINATTSAQTGDWVFIYINVNDVFDYGRVKCTSTDGSIFFIATTDNLYMDNGDGDYLKTVNINGIDTIVLVKEVKFEIQ